MASRITILAFAALSLAGCDAAGTALDEPMRQAFMQQCREVAQGSNVPAANVERFCDCSADKWLELPVTERATPDRTVIEDVLTTCVGSAGGLEAPAATENENG